MTKIILIGSIKGGVGKSTTATNLAVWLKLEGKDVMLVDADKQGTATKFVNRRDATDKVKIKGMVKLKDLYQSVRNLSHRHPESYVIVDAGGFDSRELRTAMAAADLMYIPIKASQADLETIPDVASLVLEARKLNAYLDARAFICMAPTNNSNRDVEDAREFMKGFPTLPLSSNIISERQVFKEALLLGLGVVEMRNAKARAEVQLLGQEIVKIIESRGGDDNED